jgi:hypothetical protein
MVNAFAYGAKDSRFESWVDRFFALADFHISFKVVDVERDTTRGTYNRAFVRKKREEGDWTDNFRRDLPGSRDLLRN